MINIDISKFKAITFEDCINNIKDTEIDTYIRRIVSDVISSGKRNHKFNDIRDDEKVDYFLRYCLIQIVPSKKWSDYAASIDDTEESLYIYLKRHFFLSTGTFPE